jgi:hypothetical protein
MGRTDPSTGRCRVDLLSSNKALSGQPCDDNRWHLVEMQGDFGASAYTLSWRLDGVVQPSITSIGQPPTTVAAFWVGDSNPKTFVLDVDDVVLRVADTTPPLLGSVTTYR